MRLAINQRKLIFFSQKNMRGPSAISMKKGTRRRQRTKKKSKSKKRRRVSVSKKRVCRASDYNDNAYSDDPGRSLPLGGEVLANQIARAVTAVCRSVQRR